MTSAQFGKALTKECFRDTLQVDPNQREKRAFPNPPQPSWLSRMLVPGLKVLADDGLVKADSLRKLDEDFQLGKKGAKREAWQWFVFSCWYQFQIKQTDPFASVA